MRVIIKTPRPPLNLFIAERAALSTSWLTLYEVPEYLVPEDPPNPEREVKAAGILINLLVANTGDVETSVQVAIERGEVSYDFGDTKPLPVGESVNFPVDKHIMVSGEKLQLRLVGGGVPAAECHVSLILNQREEFTVLTQE